MTSRTPASSPVSEDLTLGLSVPDGGPSPSPRSTPTPRRSSPNDGRESRTSGASSTSPVAFDVYDSVNSRPDYETTDPVRVGGMLGIAQSSGPAAFPAKTSASSESDEAWARAHDPASPMPFSLWPSDTDLGMSSSKTFRDFSPVMAGETWRRSSVRWSNSGMAWDTGSSTLATSECRSADGECSSSESRLADVLEPSAPQRFYLSARAAAGILRRASARGRSLPPSLDMALRQTALGAPAPSAPDSDTTATPTERRTGSADGSSPWLLTMREGKDGGGKGPLLSEDMSLTMGTSPTQTLFDGPSVRRLTPTECERLMGWPDGWTIAAWPQRSTRAATRVGSEPNPASTSSRHRSKRAPATTVTPVREETEATTSSPEAA